tara:strand:+ start:1138 stop:1422 length:285 start_codon:yes stop_codon:yes gene_type:complete
MLTLEGIPGGGLRITLRILELMGVTPGGGLNIILPLLLGEGISSLGTPIDGSKTSNTSKFKETLGDNCALDELINSLLRNRKKSNRIKPLLKIK